MAWRTCFFVWRLRRKTRAAQTMKAAPVTTRREVQATRIRFAGQMAKFSGRFVGQAIVRTGLAAGRAQVQRNDFRQLGLDLECFGIHAPRLPALDGATNISFMEAKFHDPLSM